MLARTTLDWFWEDDAVRFEIIILGEWETYHFWLRLRSIAEAMSVKRSRSIAKGSSPARATTYSNPKKEIPLDNSPPKMTAKHISRTLITAAFL